ncbi:MAG TPA: hypothetical protein VHR66_04550 [Gemmataceae bacterium]|jgi:hypothetical protein|nr:hypothetical protein [Gemmataceae bacterium]
MSNDRPAEPSLFRRLRESAALNYLIMTGGGLFAYALIMVSRGNDIGVMLAGVFAVAGILARWTAAPVLILLITTYLSIDPGFINAIGVFGGSPWFFARPIGGFNLEDLILAAGLLAYSIGHYRLTVMLHDGMPSEPTVQREPSVLLPRRPASLVSKEELPRTLMIAGGCVVVAQIGWLVLVAIEKAGRPRLSEFSPNAARFFLYAWVLGLALMVISAALVYLRGAGMTQPEAATLLRDEFFQENRRETDRLQRWRRWFKEKVARRRRSGK